MTSYSRRTTASKEDDMEVKTNWTTATTNIGIALAQLVSCIESGHNAWIELRVNGHQDYPIVRPNHELDDPFNWKMLYSAPDIGKNTKFLNETEKDLTYNWVDVRSTKEAAELYKKTGEISEGLIFGDYVNIPVRREDANRYRKEFAKDNYEYRWITTWTPKDGIPSYVPDKTVGQVFTICYTDEKVDRAFLMRKSAEILLKYADNIE